MPLAGIATLVLSSLGGLIARVVPSENLVWHEIIDTLPSAGFAHGP